VLFTLHVLISGLLFYCNTPQDEKSFYSSVIVNPAHLQKDMFAFLFKSVENKWRKSQNFSALEGQRTPLLNPFPAELNRSRYFQI
jgi:hypothetical protein